MKGGFVAKKKPCMEPGCELPKHQTRQRCVWHWLATQPMEVQEEAAQFRLGQVDPDQRRSRVPEGEWPQGSRWCSGCQFMVPLFYCRGSRCRACSSRAAHRGAIERKYLWPEGMTYELLLARQGGRCAICRQVPRSRRMAVDHDHDTGYVRGLLCSGEQGCNKGLLGSAHDNVQILYNAVYYLESPPSGTEGQRAAFVPTLRSG